VRRKNLVFGLIYHLRAALNLLVLAETG